MEPARAQQAALAQSRRDAAHRPSGRADRQRQVGAGARSGREARRHHHQCRFHAGLSRSAHHHRAADAGGGSAGAASALRPCRRGGELFGRALVPGCAATRWPRLQRAGAPADPGRRHRALFQGADAGACGRAADPRRTSAQPSGTGSRPRASRRSMPSSAIAIRRPRGVSGPVIAPASPARSRWS